MSDDFNMRVWRTWTRRDMLRLVGVGALGLVVTACDNNGNNGGSGSNAGPSPGVAGGTDFSARFANFPVADEPNGDLSKVVWPDFIERGGADVKALYEFQILNGDLMKYMPCFCGCQNEDGHLNNRDCYVERVNPDGSVEFDMMAPT